MRMSAFAEHKQPSGPVPKHSWVKCMSRSQNKPYWFHVPTGRSVWEEPVECRTEATPAIQTEKLAVAEPVRNLHHPDAFMSANTDVYTAGMDMSRYREAILSICMRIAEGDDTVEDAVGYHRFPPAPAADTGGLCAYTIAEVADETGLSTVTTGDDKIPPHVAVWREGCEPPEVAAAAAEETRLEKEAAARRVAEARAAAAAAKEAKERADKDRAERGSKRGVLDGVEIAGAGSVPVALAASGPTTGGAAGQQAARWASKRDKRSIAEMTEDIRRKKARAEEAAAGEDQGEGQA